jgi:hypothetical protein
VAQVMQIKRAVALAAGGIAVAGVFLLVNAAFLTLDSHSYIAEKIWTPAGSTLFVLLVGVLLFEAYRFLRYFFKK